MIDSEVSNTFTTIRSSKFDSDRFRLSFLTSREREKLERLALAKLEHASLREHEKLLNFEDIILRIENLIQYLHSYVRFFIENINDDFSLAIELSSKKSTKFSFNIDILKVFCDIFMNETQNKKWKKKLMYKIRADVSCYLIMLDKKFRQKKIKISSYHLTDKFESRIAVFNVWFIQDFTNERLRDKHMRKIVKRHQRWKTRAIFIYIKNCELYVLERKDWEFHIVLKVWQKSYILWSRIINFFDRLINLISISYNLYEEKNNFTKWVEQKNISCLNVTIYADKFESEIFFDFEDAEKSFTSNTSFSAKNMFDDEQFVNSSQDAFQDNANNNF